MGNEIILKNVKVIIGWENLIKHKYSKYVGTFDHGDIAVLRGKGKSIYLFNPYSLDEYKLSETGLRVKEYYSRPDYTIKRYKVFVSNDSFNSTTTERLHNMGILSDIIYSKIVSEDKERKLTYFRNREKEALGNLNYIRGEIKKNESIT